jgi:hypothetical protein
MNSNSSQIHVNDVVAFSSVLFEIDVAEEKWEALLEA